MLMFMKFQYLLNGLRFGFYYGLRFCSNWFIHSVKQFGRFGLDTLILSEKRNIFPKLTGPHFINQTDPCNTIITSPKGDGVILIGNA